jgi:hypothetical protein
LATPNYGYEKRQKELAKKKKKEEKLKSKAERKVNPDGSVDSQDDLPQQDDSSVVPSEGSSAGQGA